MSAKKAQKRLVNIEPDTRDRTLSGKIKIIAKGIEDAYLELGALPNSDYSYKDLINAAVERLNNYRELLVVRIENSEGSLDHKV